MGVGTTEVWIFDERDFRRAGLVALVSSWITEEGVAIRPIGTVAELSAEIASRLERGAESGILIANLGADSLSVAQTRRSIEAVIAGIGEWPVLVVSDIEGQDEVELAISLGARALLQSNMAAGVASAAIRFVLAGGTYFEHPAQTGVALSDQTARVGTQRSTHIVQNTVTGRSAVLDKSNAGRVLNLEEGRATPSLTQRQRDVLDALQGGLTNKAIARELNLSEATVKVHVRQLMKKFGAMNRTQVALAAPRLSTPRATSPEHARYPQ